MDANNDKFNKAITDGHSAAWEKDWKTAISHYTSALKEKPGDQKAISSIALAFFEAGEYERSLEHYVHLAKIVPSDPIPLEKISVIYEKQGRQQPSAEASLRAADLYFKLKNVDKAIENWTRTALLDVNNFHAHSRLALIYEKLGKKDYAVREYLNFASLMQQSGEHEKAVQGVNRALQISPDNEDANQALDMLRANIQLPTPLPPASESAQPEIMDIGIFDDPGEEPDDVGDDPVEAAHQKALETLAVLFFDLTSSEESSEDRDKVGLQDIVDDAGSGGERYNQSQIMLHLSTALDLQSRGEHMKAAEELKGALESGLVNVAAVYEIGYFHAESDRFGSATRYLEMAANDEKYALGANLLLGDVYLDLNKVNEGTQCYLKALRIADCSMVSLEQARHLDALYDPLIEAQKYESDEEAMMQISMNIKDLLRRDRWQEHFSNVRNQLSGSDDDLEIVPVAELLLEAKSTYIVDAMTKVRSLVREGLHNSAMEEAFFILDEAPTYLPVHILIGDILVQQGLKEDAMKKYLTVANSYSSRGDTGRSIELFRKVVRLTPMDDEPRKRLIAQLIKLDEYDQAVDEMVNLAETHYQMADLTRSRQTYSEALNLTQHPGVDLAWRSKILHQIADIDMQSLDWRTAIKNYEILLKLDSSDTKALRNLADLKVRMGRKMDAVQAIDAHIKDLRKDQKEDEIILLMSELINEIPDQAPFHYRYAESLKLMDRTDDAIAQFDKAGELFSSTGENAAAVSAYKEVLAIGPSNPKKYQKLIKKLES